MRWAKESLFARMSRIARQRDDEKELCRLLEEAAIKAGMPVDQQLRFSNMLMQMSRERLKLEPLPMPPAIPDEER